MIFYNTINDVLKDQLLIIMSAQLFEPFRLVGGTALSLQIGHRRSIDIDLFTDAPYRSIDFNNIEKFIIKTFPYHDLSSNLPIAMGKSYLIGPEKSKAIKLDLFYTDSFIQPPLIQDTIKMATVDEIIAMKIDVIQRTGRKKDFWDLHELLPQYTIESMLRLHKKRYPYSHDRSLILKNFTNFQLADDDFDPICLRGKYWEFIKEDIIEQVEAYKNK